MRVSEQRRRRLGVVHSPLDIAAVGGANDDRRGPLAGRPVAHGGQFVANLHERGPDVVDELNLGHGLETAGRHPDRAADDVCFGERRIVHAVAPEAGLQTVGDLEDAALARDLAQRLLARGVGDILAEDDDPRVTFHFGAQTPVEQVDHGERAFFGKNRPVLGVEVGAGRVDGLGVEPLLGRVRRRLGVFEGLVRGCRHGRPDVRFHAVEFVCGRGAGIEQKTARLAQRIAPVLRLALRRTPVHRFVVGSGVRIRTGGVCVQQRRLPLPAAPLHGLARGPVAFEEVSPVALDDLQIGEPGKEARHVAAGRLYLNGDRDGVLVVLDQEQDGQLQVARRIEGFPELALRRGAVARRAEYDLVVSEWPHVVAQFRRHARPHARFRAADRVQELCARRRGRGHDVEALVREVGRHLAPAAGGIRLGPHPLEQLFHRRHAECEREGPVSVVEQEPVRPRPQIIGQCHLYRLMAGAGDQEEDLALLVELGFAVVDVARGDHGPVPAQQGLPVGKVGFDVRAEFVFQCGHVFQYEVMQR